MKEMAHTPGPWSVDEAGDIVSGPYNVCIPYATTDADKALMAAAPDLLAALQALLADCGDAGSDGYVENSIHSDEVNAARAAIAKALPTQETKTKEDGE